MDVDPEREWYVEFLWWLIDNCPDKIDVWLPPWSKETPWLPDFRLG